DSPASSASDEDDLVDREARQRDMESLDRQRWRAREPSPHFRGAIRRCLRALKPVLRDQLRQAGVGIDGRGETGLLEQLAPSPRSVIAYVRCIAQSFDLVDEARKVGIIGRAIVYEHEKTAGPAEPTSPE